MMTKKEEWMYDVLVEFMVATEQEINLVRCCRYGSWEEVLEAILYVRTGYQSFDQFICDTLGEDDDWDEDPRLEEDDIYQDW